MATTFMTQMADESGSMSCSWQCSVTALGWGYKTRSLVDVNKKKTTLMAWEAAASCSYHKQSFLMWLPWRNASLISPLPSPDAMVIESNAVWAPLTSTNCSSIPAVDNNWSQSPDIDERRILIMTTFNDSCIYPTLLNRIKILINPSTRSSINFEIG